MSEDDLGSDSAVQAIVGASTSVESKMLKAALQSQLSEDFDRSDIRESESEHTVISVLETRVVQRGLLKFFDGAAGYR